MLTSVARHAAGGTGRGEEDKGVTEELDVRLDRRALFLSELLLARVEREPGRNLLSASPSSSSRAAALTS
jgi:hypothetical protein